MIAHDKLVEGVWYDGFVWNKQRQQGVATAQYMGGDGFRAHYRGGTMDLAYRDTNRGTWEFEPNVPSLGRIDWNGGD